MRSSCVVAAASSTRPVHRMRRLTASLLAEDGLWVPAIRPPTVAAHTARLRVTLSAAHAASDVERLTDSLNRLEQRVEQASPA